MAHMIDFSNDRANMAFSTSGGTPWHGLGISMDEAADLDQWRVAAGLEWSAIKTPEMYKHNGNTIESGEFILMRSDTGAKLGNCTERYKPVQPSEVTEFYRDLCSDYNFKLETMGSLDSGKRIWALAKTGDQFSIMGQDHVGSYLLLATSYDGTMATTAMFTSVRVVCHNTLTLANNKAESAIRVPHSTNFDHHDVKIDLGIYSGQLKAFEEKANALAKVTVGKKQALDFIFNLLKEKEVDIEACSTRKANIIGNILDLHLGKAKGANFRSSQNTAWGLLNAVTEYVDHVQGNNVNNRFKSAQFGAGAKLKEKAFADILTLAA